MEAVMREEGIPANNQRLVRGIIKEILADVYFEGKIRGRRGRF